MTQRASFRSPDEPEPELQLLLQFMSLTLFLHGHSYPVILTQQCIILFSLTCTHTHQPHLYPHQYTHHHPHHYPHNLHPPINPPIHPLTRVRLLVRWRQATMHISHALDSTRGVCVGGEDRNIQKSFRQRLRVYACACVRVCLLTCTVCGCRNCDLSNHYFRRQRNHNA